MDEEIRIVMVTLQALENLVKGIHHRSALQKEIGLLVEEQVDQVRNCMNLLIAQRVAEQGRESG